MAKKTEKKAVAKKVVAAAPKKVVKKTAKLVATTKADFVKALKENICESIGMTNDQAKIVYDTFIKIMADTISANEKLNLNGVGTFKVRKMAARAGINPRTREKIKIKASKTVGFRPTPTFKKEL